MLHLSGLSLAERQADGYPTARGGEGRSARGAEARGRKDDTGGGHRRSGARQQADNRYARTARGVVGKQLRRRYVRRPGHARGPDAALVRQHRAERTLPRPDKRLDTAEEAALAADGEGEDRQPGRGAGRVRRGRDGMHAPLVGRRAQRRRRQPRSPRRGVLLEKPVRRRARARPVHARPRRRAAKQPAQLRLRHTARRSGPLARVERAAAHARHTPPQPIQRLLLGRRRDGALPPLRRPARTRHRRRNARQRARRPNQGT